jgi:prepilin-type N-terminal cleavage/methylation domain-containing protein
MEQKNTKKKFFCLTHLFICTPHRPKRKSPYFFDQKGFSLIEILIVLFLIAFLSGLAILQTSGWIERYRLRGATRLVWEDLQSAKMTAIKNNQSITVTFISTTGYTFSQAGSAIFTRNLAIDYPSISVVKDGGASLIFSSTGLTQNATITVQGAGGSKSITTLWTGRITMT